VSIPAEVVLKARRVHKRILALLDYSWSVRRLLSLEQELSSSRLRLRRLCCNSLVDNRLHISSLSLNVGSVWLTNSAPFERIRFLNEHARLISHEIKLAVVQSRFLYFHS
jgi:hypothetical protein